MHYVFRRGWYYFMKLLSYISIYASVWIVMYNELHRVSHSQKSSKATGRGPRNRQSGRPVSSPHAVTSRVLPVCHRCPKSQYPTQPPSAPLPQFLPLRGTQQVLQSRVPAPRWGAGRAFQTAAGTHPWLTGAPLQCGHGRAWVFSPRLITSAPRLQ